MQILMSNLHVFTCGFLKISDMTRGGPWQNFRPKITTQLWMLFMMSYEFTSPGGSLLKNPPVNAGDTGLIPGSGRSPGEGNGIYSSILAWEIPWTEEPGGLRSMGLQRVGHDWSDLAAAYYKNFKTIYSKFFLLILCAFVVMQTYNTFIHVKVMANLDSILKSRDITLLTKVRLVKAMVFPVVMYGCESCTVKKAERRRVNAVEPWAKIPRRPPWTFCNHLLSMKRHSPWFLVTCNLVAAAESSQGWEIWNLGFISSRHPGSHSLIPPLWVWYHYLGALGVRNGILVTLCPLLREIFPLKV